MLVAALTAAVLSAAPPPPPSLAADDAAERLSAVQTWVKKQKKPQLSSKDARAIAECIELPAVKETGCEHKAKLCRLHEGDDGSSGTRVESLSLLMAGEEHDVQPLRVWWSAAYEAKVSDCDPPEHLLGHETAEQRVEAIAAWKKKNVKEFTRCVERLEKKAKADAEELTCDLMLVNACRREAYVTCKTRNLREGIQALEQLHRFEF
ncbi:MAG: hypothetical protein Q8N23_05430 [Archangium sp.]|nr:hypothetical protein [Archangium sp.]